MMSLKQAVAALDKILEDPNFAKKNSKSDLPMQYACLIRPLPPVLDLKTNFDYCQEPNGSNKYLLSNTESFNVRRGYFDVSDEVKNGIQVVASFDFGDDVTSMEDTYEDVSVCSSLKDFGHSSSSNACITVTPANLFEETNNGVELIQIEGKLNEGFIPLDPKKYKTELCRSYHVHGYCKYGISRCNYAHGINQLKIAFHHGKYKTRNCQSYHETGTCRYGARCSFIHDPEEGILKCPITDREILEALHYFPLERRSVANITWKVIDSTFSQSELYFFANPPNFQWSTNGTPYSTIFDLNISDCGEDIEGKLKPILSSPSNGVSIPTFSKCDEPNKILEYDECSSKNDSETDCSSKSTSIENESDKLGRIEIHYTKVTDLENKSEKITTNAHNKSPEMDAKKIRNNFSAESLNRREIGTSNSKTSFSLNDFLRCLKTKEGEQHLAPWSPEPPKICKEVELPTPKQKKVPNKVEFTCRARDMTKYKTELCRSYQYNRYCEYGDTCLYAHGKIDLRSYPKHPMYRTKKCYSFHYKGFCLYGSRCQFLHDLSF